jgi:uncharacterized protein
MDNNVMKSYACPKCGSTSYKKDEMRATGTYLAKLFDVQNRKFITISCERCGYTEFYKRQSNMLGDIFDFLMD